MQAIYYEGNIEQNFIGHICAEIFRDRIYDPYLANKEELNIVDLGANVGLFSLYAYPHAKHIWAVEPAVEHFNCLSEMAKFNQMDRITPIKKAIGTSNGTIELIKNPRNKTMYSTSPAMGQFLDEQKWGREAPET